MQSFFSLLRVWFMPDSLLLHSNCAWLGIYAHFTTLLYFKLFNLTKVYTVTCTTDLSATLVPTHPPSSLLDSPVWKARINLGFEAGRKPIHSPIPLSDPPSWAHLFQMNSHGHRWTHTKIDRDAHTHNKWGQIGAYVLHVDTYTHSQHQHISCHSLFLCECQT